MMLATLESLILPPQFSYKPYVPRKRNTVTPTAGAVVTQYSDPQIVHGDGSISWIIEAAYPTEFNSLWDLYNTPTPTLYTFSGYWGEVLEVYFTNLDSPTVKGRLFNLSGQFQVVCVVQDYNLTCM